MDYAIVKTGSKQYRVKPGDLVDVEKLPAEEGSSVELTDVLAVSRDGELILGNPLVPEASVGAQVRTQGKDRKILVFKFKRKVRYQRKMGHRQPYTRLFITSITVDGVEIGLPPRWTEYMTAVPEETLVQEVSEEQEDGEFEEELADQLDVEAEEELTDEVDESQDEIAVGAEEQTSDVLVGELEEELADEPVEEVEVAPGPEPTEQPKSEPEDEPKRSSRARRKE